MTVCGPAGLRRGAALLILAVMTAVLWLGPVGAYLAMIGHDAERIAERAALLARYRALVRSGPPAVSAAPKLTFPDLPESQASAVLQERVKTAAANARVQVQNLQVLRSEAVPGAMRIGVRIRASGDVASLRGLLYAIETARPVLYPDNLQVHAHMAGERAAAPLDFQLDVSGFAARGGA
jgi:general secretion pathway protein M